MRFLTVTVALLAATLCACKQQPSSATNTSTLTNSASGEPTYFLTNAQPRLQTIKLYIGPEELTTELALTREQMATGMMWRTNMPEGEAMLFAFGQPHRTSFYMKNTLVPLSAAYIDPDGAILELHDFQPHNPTPVEAKSDNIQYVLEVPQGWFKRHNISTGMTMRSQFGPLKNTFSFKPQ